MKDGILYIYFDKEVDIEDVRISDKIDRHIIWEDYKKNGDNYKMENLVHRGAIIRINGYINVKINENEI